jgi:cell division protein FtsL
MKKRNNKEVILGILMILGGALFLGIIRSANIYLKYEISALQKEREELLRKKKELKLEIALSTSPSELERLAREKLGMRFPKRDEVIVLGEGNEP